MPDTPSSERVDAFLATVLAREADLQRLVSERQDVVHACKDACFTFRTAAERFRETVRDARALLARIRASKHESTFDLHLEETQRK